MRDYIEGMKGSYEFYTRRAAATINPNGLTINARVFSQKALGIDKATKTLKSTQFGVSYEEAQAFYNHLASKPDWYRAFTEWTPAGDASRVPAAADARQRGQACRYRLLPHCSR